MRFSVIIPFYNRATFVESVLQSVDCQSERDFEIIAVDDGSTDETWDLLNSHPAKPKCIRIENSGAAIARNKAAAIARGQYLAFLDSDDLWFPNTLSLYRKVIEDFDQPAVVTGNPAVFSGLQAPEQALGQPMETEVFQNYLEAFDDWRWFGVSSFVIRREDFNEAGGFTAQRLNAEDADLMLKLGCSPGFVHIRQPHTFAYRRHESNLTTNQSMNLSGLRHIVDCEKNGQYPGQAKQQRRNRRIIITRHLRPVIISLLNAGKGKDAWELFKPSLPWHIHQLRFRFLLFATFKRLASSIQAK